jgi:hypothetical protein
MSKLILDETLRSKLNGLNEEIELCDESGRTLGHVLPAAIYQKLLYASFEEPPFTSEEVERRRHEQGGRSLAEIWKRLGRIRSLLSPAKVFQ